MTVDAKPETALVTVDFSKLTLMDALDLAILIEEEARERYEEFADQMEVHRTEAAATFYKFMAENEKKHGEELLSRRKAAFAETPTRMNRSLLWDVEAPEYDKARAFMSPRQALMVALESELKAFAFFKAAIPHISDPEVKDVFVDLMKEEEHHEALVRAELEKLPPEEDVDPDDYTDEPTAQ